jgi:hypothetical protein
MEGKGLAANAFHSYDFSAPLILQFYYPAVIGE